MTESSVDAIRHALAVARKNGYVEVELETPEGAFEAKLGPSSAHLAPIAFPDLPVASLEAPVQSTAEIAATLVGYYHEADPPLAVGRIVSKGDVVAVIEALGLANEVESTVSGEVTEVFVSAGQSVQFGQGLAQVRLR